MSKMRQILIVVMLLAGGAACLYVLGSAWPGGNKEANTAAKGKPPAPQLHAWLQLSPRPATPRAAFTAMDGASKTLADFTGKPVLLNVWATWCEPCIREMPALDRLAGQLGQNGPFQVLTVNEDRNPEDAQKWLTDNQIHNLPLHGDGKLALVRDLYVANYPSGLPVSVLYDANGHEVARWYGEAHWDTAEMMGQIMDLLGIQSSTVEGTAEQSVKPASAH